MILVIMALNSYLEVTSLGVHLYSMAVLVLCFDDLLLLLSKCICLAKCSKM